jgi:hypothetical protein
MLRTVLTVFVTFDAKGMAHSKAYLRVERFCWDMANVNDKRKARKTRLVWAVLMLVGFSVAVSIPYIDAYVVKHISLDIAVPFEFNAALLSASSILFGFTSLIIISKEWVERKFWAILLPPLALIIISGTATSNLALGYANPVQTLLLSSATFNANVVSTGLVLGYVSQKLSTPKK